VSGQVGQGGRSPESLDPRPDRPFRPATSGAPAGHRGRLDLLPIGAEIGVLADSTVDLSRVPR
jgi:hypothetical protein